MNPAVAVIVHKMLAEGIQIKNKLTQTGGTFFLGRQPTCCLFVAGMMDGVLS
jgi:hypothetical protein